MSQKKVYLYSPDGKGENWFMEDEAPPGWVRSKPEAIEGDVLPGGGDPDLKGYDPPEQATSLTDDERLAEAERLQEQGRMEEAEVVLEGIK